MVFLLKKKYQDKHPKRSGFFERSNYLEKKNQDLVSFFQVLFFCKGFESKKKLYDIWNHMLKEKFTFFYKKIFVGRTFRGNQMCPGTLRRLIFLFRLRSDTLSQFNQISNLMAKGNQMSFSLRFFLFLCQSNEIHLDFGSRFVSIWKCVDISLNFVTFIHFRDFVLV